MQINNKNNNDKRTIHHKNKTEDKNKISLNKMEAQRKKPLTNLKDDNEGQPSHHETPIKHRWVALVVSEISVSVCRCVRKCGRWMVRWLL